MPKLDDPDLVRLIRTYNRRERQLRRSCARQERAEQRYSEAFDRLTAALHGRAERGRMACVVYRDQCFISDPVGDGRNLEIVEAARLPDS